MIRLLDVFFSLSAILLLSPLLITCAIILRFTGEGEVLYLQNRVGKNMKVFSLFKFATMVKNSEKIGAGTVTLRNDPRVLPFGKFLRITKINELPQLFNILFGDMSVIGPRPLLNKQFSMYSDENKAIISSISPGLSGVGSIIFRDEEEMLSQAKDPLEYYENFISPYKAYLEKWYVQKRSIFLYFKLIFITLLAVIFKKINPLGMISKRLVSFEEYFQSTKAE